MANSAANAAKRTLREIKNKQKKRGPKRIAHYEECKKMRFPLDGEIALPNITVYYCSRLRHGSVPCAFKIPTNPTLFLTDLRLPLVVCLFIVGTTTFAKCQQTCQRPSIRLHRILNDLAFLEVYLTSTAINDVVPRLRVIANQRELRT